MVLFCLKFEYWILLLINEFQWWHTSCCYVSVFTNPLSIQDNAINFQHQPNCLNVVQSLGGYELEKRFLLVLSMHLKHNSNICELYWNFWCTCVFWSNLVYNRVIHLHVFAGVYEYNGAQRFVKFHWADQTNLSNPAKSQIFTPSPRILAEEMLKV